jgi:hypothetical protein
MFWKKKTSVTAVETCAHALFQTLAEGLKRDGRIRAEDIITAAASIVGESCIVAAADFNPRKHEFVPGSRVFSTRVNELFSGDVPDESIDGLPAGSIVGTLRDRLVVSGFDRSDFPQLKKIFQDFAASVGKPSTWGSVPLSIPSQNMPSILPLRVAYETRPMVDRLFETLENPGDRLHASVLALAETLIAVREVIDRKTALLLALQIVNGMAKTAPMTDDAMKAAQKQSGG